MEALSGEWRQAGRGVITIMGSDAGHLGPARRRRLGLGIVPEERNGHAAVETARYGAIDFNRTRKLADRVVKEFDVRLPHTNPLATALSGGNLQKFVVGREMLARPSVLVVAQPTWGVDVAAATFIRNAISQLASNGAAVVMISQDLEEVLALSNRVAVLFEGRLSSPVASTGLTARKVGLMLAGARPDRKADKGRKSHGAGRVQTNRAGAHTRKAGTAAKRVGTCA